MAKTPVSKLDIVQAFGDRLREAGVGGTLIAMGETLALAEAVKAALEIGRAHCCTGVRLRHPMDECEDPDVHAVELMLEWPEGSYGADGYFRRRLRPPSGTVPEAGYPDGWVRQGGCVHPSGSWDDRVDQREEYCESATSRVAKALDSWNAEWSCSDKSIVNACKARFDERRLRGDGEALAFTQASDQAHIRGAVVYFTCDMTDAQVEEATLSHEAIALFQAFRLEGGKRPVRQRRLG